MLYIRASSQTCSSVSHTAWPNTRLENEQLHNLTNSIATLNYICQLLHSIEHKLAHNSINKNKMLCTQYQCLKIHENSASLPPKKRIFFCNFLKLKTKQNVAITPQSNFGTVSWINMRAGLGAIARLLPCVTWMSQVQILKTTSQLDAVKPHTFTLPKPPFLETSCTESPFYIMKMDMKYL